MKCMNLLLATIAIFMILLSGCRTSGNSNSANANIANNANQNKVKREVKPADFTITAEELSQEFRQKGATLDDQRNRNFELWKKYHDKTFAVTGKIWRIWRKNRGMSFNYVFLYPDLENKDKQKLDYFSEGIQCTFGDSEAQQMEPLKSGDTVTIQGLYEGPSLYERGNVRFYAMPSFKNCVVVEIK